EAAPNTPAQERGPVLSPLVLADHPDPAVGAAEHAAREDVRDVVPPSTAPTASSLQADLDAPKQLVRHDPREIVLHRIAERSPMASVDALTRLHLAQHRPVRQQLAHVGAVPAVPWA